MAHINLIELAYENQIKKQEHPKIDTLNRKTDNKKSGQVWKAWSSVTADCWLLSVIHTS